MDGYAAVLAGVPGLGAKRLRLLIEYFGSPEAAWQADEKQLKQAGLLEEKVTACLLDEKKTADPEKMVRKLDALGVRCCTWLDEDYPPLLKETVNPPAVLFYKGAPPVWEKTIAIVGARKATAYGINAAKRISADLARKGVTIVSGGARGIDTCAHKGALEGGAPTVAVMACGLDVTYPPENRNLFEQICAAGGTVISEYPPGTPPLGRQFPARNRIIAGMSRGVAVTEAAQRSGSLITADFALEEGRDVFAVPGSIWSSMSRGTHHLIRSGAICTTGAEDILSEYGWDETEKIQENKAQELTLEEEMVYRFCSMGEAVPEEDLLAQTGLSVARMSMILLQLQLKGFVTEAAQGHFTASRNR